MPVLFYYVMFLINTDGLSKIRLNYSDESAEGGKMLEDGLIDFSEDQDNQVKINAWQKGLRLHLLRNFSFESYRQFLQPELMPSRFRSHLKM